MSTPEFPVGKVRLSTCSSELPAVLILGAATWALFVQVWLGPGGYPLSLTDLTPILAYHIFDRDCFQSGIFPLWNPHVFTGVPWIHMLNSAVFYPFHFLYARMGWWPDGLAVFEWAHLWLSAVFMYGFLRTATLGVAPALCGAVIWCLNRTLVLRVTSGELEVLTSQIWIPGIFWSVLLGIKNRSFFPWVLAGAAMAMAIYAGNPEVPIFTTYALLAFLFFRPVRQIETRWIGGILIMFGACFLLGAAQILPTLELFSLSNRGGEAFADSSCAVAPAHLVVFLFPDFYGNPLDKTFWGPYCSIWGPYTYAGLLTWVLAGVGAFRSTPPTFARTGRFWMIFALVCLLFSMGHRTPLLPFFRNILPFFSTFRMPYKFLVFVVFGLAVAAAFGMQRMRDVRPSGLVRKILAGGLIGCAVISLALFISKDVLLPKISAKGHEFLDKRLESHRTYSGGRFSSDAVEEFHRRVDKVAAVLVGSTSRSLLIAAASMAVLLYVLRRPAEDRKLWLCAAVAGADLLLFNIPFVRDSSFDLYFPRRPIIDAIQNADRQAREPGGRVACEDDIWAPTEGMIWKINEIGGIVALSLGNFHEFVDAMTGVKRPYSSKILGFPVTIPALNELLDIRYTVFRKNSPQPDWPVLYEGRIRTYERKDYMDYLFLKEEDLVLRKVPVPEQHAYAPSRIEYAAKPDLPGKIHSLSVPLMVSYLEGEGSAEDLSAAEISVTGYGINDVSLTASAAGRALVVLKDPMFPGWRVWVNEKEASPVTVNGLHRGVFVGGGIDQQIVWKFQPRSVYVGCGIAMVSAVMFCLYLAFVMRLEFKNR